MIVVVVTTRRLDDLDGLLCCIRAFTPHRLANSLTGDDLTIVQLPAEVGKLHGFRKSVESHQKIIRFQFCSSFMSVPRRELGPLRVSQAQSYESEKISLSPKMISKCGEDEGSKVT